MAEPLPAALAPDVLERARDRARQTGTGVMPALQAVTGWAPDTVVSAVAAAFGQRHLPMASLHGLRPMFQVMPFAECSQRLVLLGEAADGAAWLVQADPFDVANEEWALRRCSAAGVRGLNLGLAAEADLQAFLALQERQLRAIDDLDVGLPAAASDGSDTAVISLTSIGGDDSPVIKLVNSTIYDALKVQASDIHLECDANCLYVQYRIDGVLVPVTQVPGRETSEQIISRIKVMAELDIAERRVPQDGRFKVRVGDRDIDFRVSVMPNIFGEDAVLRLLDRQALSDQARGLRLDHLGLDAGAIHLIRRLSAKPHGMLLVTGPTGSGKTTTLYAAITEIHTGQDKIVTIEDPVEYRLPRVLQIPVNEKKGLTFARGLRSILRHDPDKIMVGEIRDGETAQIAVQAALTGHLVFTTVHANSVFDVLGRFMHMGVDPYSLASALNGIVAQRLLRTNCVACSETVPADADLLAQAGVKGRDCDGWRLLAGRGCGLCRGTGYKGRRAVAEVLVLDDGLRELIAARAPHAQLKASAAEAGLRSLNEQALAMVARGETTLQEVLRVTG